MRNKRHLALNACRLLKAPRWWGLFDRWEGLITLNYHRIGQFQETPIDPGVFSASAEQFEAQLRYLKLNFDVIRVSDIADVLREGAHRRAVLISFDDGYQDNYDVAFPILKQVGLSALIFLTTGFLDQHSVAWWDEIAWMIKQSTHPRIVLPEEWKTDPIEMHPVNREDAARCLLRLAKTFSTTDLSRFLSDLGASAGTGRAPRDQTTAPWMSWDMVREMASAGMEFGGHTVNHPVLSMCTVDEQRYEIIESKQRIESELGRPITTFSYPTGKPWSFNEDTRRLAYEAGYEWGFAFDNGYATHLSPPLGLERVAVEPDIGMDEFEAIVQIPRIFARRRTSPQMPSDIA